MKLVKDGIEKEISNPETIARLKRQGWQEEGKPEKKAAEKELEDDAETGNFDKAAALAALKAKGVNIHHSTGIDKLKAALEEHGITL